MASAVDSRLAYARLSAVATASRLPTANRGSNNSYTTSWDTTIQPVIPNKTNRKQTHAFDRKRYKDRNGIERMVGRLKDYRRIAMRYDKNAGNFMAALCLAALNLLLDLYESGP